MGIFDTLRYRWRVSSMLIRIIYVNIAVFVVLMLLNFVCSLLNSAFASWLLTWIELPSDLGVFLTRPWTIVTYMFAQYDVFHILFNMVWLYWFGAIFLIVGDQRRLTALYVYGGVGGGLLFMLAYNFLPVFAGVHGWLIGSSASVIAIVAATAILHPDYKVGLLFLGPVALKWIAIVTIAIDFMSVTGANGGGHVSHIGGAIVGLIYAMALKRGSDITRPFNQAVDSLVNLFKRLKPIPREKRSYNAYRRPASGNNGSAYSGGRSASNRQNEAELDVILEKIKKNGYSGLTQEEKKRLFDISKKIK
ncbi:MAG: rhomboid family intramembrane serine protease [Muribaculum sp.]|nr:rhomboid family intramembrane serine protease [Muribaculum sp.]